MSLVGGEFYDGAPSVFSISMEPSRVGRTVKSQGSWRLQKSMRWRLRCAHYENGVQSWTETS